jgi:hypothetical protein
VGIGIDRHADLSQPDHSKLVFVHSWVLAVVIDVYIRPDDLGECIRVLKLFQYQISYTSTSRYSLLRLLYLEVSNIIVLLAAGTDPNNVTS